jgi:capsule polysaccharide export protein KpsE/RkpR
MANELPTLKSTEKELESIYESHSNRFFVGLEQNGISTNSSRDIAQLAHSELVKRSNNRFSRKSTFLTYSVITLSVITLSFAFLDYVGDMQWQKDQITELQNINKNLIEKNSQIEILQSEFNASNEKIKKLEQRIQLIEKETGQKKK